MIVVVSTGNNAPTRERCIASVKGQTVERRHIYVERPEKCQLQNYWETISMLDPDDIVVMVDGDDWLAHERVLETVKAMHDRGTWLTYGSYQCADGRPGICRGFEGGNVRRVPWIFSHLKTFRAGLYQKIRQVDLMHDGNFVLHGTDLRIMYPMLEMAGPERTAFCPEILYVYNYQTSWEWTAKPEALAEENRIVALTRAMPPYERLACL